MTSESPENGVGDAGRGCDKGVGGREKEVGVRGKGDTIPEGKKRCFGRSVILIWVPRFGNLVVGWVGEGSGIVVGSDGVCVVGSC